MQYKTEQNPDSRYMYYPSLSLDKKSARNCFEIGKLTLLHSLLFVALDMVMAQTFKDKILLIYGLAVFIRTIFFRGIFVLAVKYLMLYVLVSLYM